MVVGVCMLASVAALALWFSTELKASPHDVAGPERTSAAEASEAAASYAAWLPEGAG